MSQPSGSRKRSQPEPIEVSLTQEKSTRHGMSLFRVTEPFTIHPSSSFVILPGPKGLGWVLKIYPDPS